jgi:hypothetical protein
LLPLPRSTRTAGFKWRNRWCGGPGPGCRAKASCPALLRLIAPRPRQIAQSERDGNPLRTTARPAIRAVSPVSAGPRPRSARPCACSRCKGQRRLRPRRRPGTRLCRTRPEPVSARTSRQAPAGNAKTAGTSEITWAAFSHEADLGADARSERPLSETSCSYRPRSGEVVTSSLLRSPSALHGRRVRRHWCRGRGSNSHGIAPGGV